MRVYGMSIKANAKQYHQKWLTQVSINRWTAVMPSKIGSLLEFSFWLYVRVSSFIISKSYAAIWLRMECINSTCSPSAAGSVSDLKCREDLWKNMIKMIFNKSYTFSSIEYGRKDATYGNNTYNIISRRKPIKCERKSTAIKKRPLLGKRTTLKQFCSTDKNS